MKNKSFLLKLIPAIIIIVATTLLSGSMNNYIMTLANTALIYFLCTAGLSLLLGIGGQLVMCSITFTGLGGFLTAQLAMKFGIPTVPALFIAVAIGTVIGLGFGLILMRLKGGFLVFGSIGLVNIGATFFQNYTPLSGGPDGLYGLPKLMIFGYTFDNMQAWFTLLSCIAVTVILLVSRIRSTSLGRSLMAVRDDEIAAATLGVHVYRTKVIAFTINCALACLAGGLLAYYNGVISSSLFTFNNQIQFVIMVMLGGVNSSIGTLIGTVIVLALPELLRPLINYLNLIYGMFIIILMIFMPMGVAGVLGSAYKKIINFKRKANTNADTR